MNTGLLDKYGSDIFVVFSTTNAANVSGSCLPDGLTLLSNKSQLKNLGFTEEVYNKLPDVIKFYKNRSELIFSAQLSQFDLDDISRFTHILDERRERFPNEYRCTDASILADKIKNEVARAIKMSERDYRYVVPMYNIKSDRIQYMMPLHLSTGVYETPELVMIVGMKDGFWKVHTIIGVNEAYDNARMLCKTDNSWLNLE